MHNRFPMYYVHALGVARLVNDFDVIPVVVCSKESPHREVIEDHFGFNYYEYKNRPLGEKANYAAICASTYDPDYVIFLDSDDIIDNNFMRAYINAMEEGYGVIGVRDLYFYGLHPKRGRFGKFGYWAGYGNPNRATGIAKCISSEVLKQVELCPFNKRVNSGLDGTMRARTGKYKPRKKVISIKDHDAFAIDIKTRGNINGFAGFPLQETDMLSTVKKYLPENEVNAILSLRDQVYNKRYGTIYN